MKLASLKHGRDGKLVVVSKDLTQAVSAYGVAQTLQQVLDDWSICEPKLRALSEQLEHGSVPSFRFREHDAASPLPRAFQWVDGSAYVNHVELVRKARNAEMPDSFWTDPLIYQGGSDSFLNPRDPIVMADEAYGIDMEGELAVVTGDVPMGVSASDAGQYIRLIMLVNDVSLRNLIPAELAKGFGFFQSKPSSAFSPVAVTPDELGEAWDGGKVHLQLLVELNGKPFGKANAGVDMTFDFGQLIAHAAKTRPLAAGSIVGSGTVSNKDKSGGPGKPASEGGLGYSCIAEIRMIETINSGKPQTPFMKFGDTVRIEMKDSSGHSIFGAIEQEVQKMAKAFASQGDMVEKKISFTEIGRDLYAFTAEGDPNTGVIIGDDGVMVVDAQATPVMAKQVVEKIRTVTDKPIKYVVLSHYHAVRVLGASGYGAEQIISSEKCRAMVHERGQEDWDSEFARFPRLFQAFESIPGLTWPTMTFQNKMSLYMGKRRVDLMHLGRAHTAGDIVAWVPDAGVMFTGDIVEYHSACYCGDAHFNDWSGTLDNIATFKPQAIAPGRGDALVGTDIVGRAIESTRDFVLSTYNPVAQVAARGGSLKEAWDACRAACDSKFTSFAIYEHCLPFNVARAYDEALGIDTPRIWTAQRDLDMWTKLQG